MTLHIEEKRVKNGPKKAFFQNLFITHLKLVTAFFGTCTWALLAKIVKSAQFRCSKTGL